VVECQEASWEAARIEAGIPAYGREITESTIAAEVGLVDRTVSFTKGCFTGQELVARIDSRGSKVARRLLGLVVEPPVGSPSTDEGDLPLRGAEIWTTDGEHQVGELSSVAWSPGLESIVGLAVLHRRVVPPEAVLLRWEVAGVTGLVHQAEATAQSLPLAG
jgi:folate-binding protein YgfZ